MKRVAVLGSTGSVGRQTLEVIRSFPDRLESCALSCHTNTELLLSQARSMRVNTLVCTQTNFADAAYRYVGEDAAYRYALEGDYDVLVVALVGIAGLRPTLAALERGKTVCLANKETLVCGGPLVKKAQAKGHGVLLPIDSEHAAILQSLRAGERGEIKRLILTASGGALRDLPLADLQKATPDMVLSHPNWSMGDKITVDCATMVNKAFEVIEACYLFDVKPSKVEVLIHRESVIHSMVQFVDNSYVAQLAVPDMRLPIQYALLYPDRVPSLVEEMDFTSRPLTFERMDAERYPTFGVVMDAFLFGAAACIAANAADEVAVEAFLKGHISFRGIHRVLEETVSRLCSSSGFVRDVEDVFEMDTNARAIAKGVVNS